VRSIVDVVPLDDARADAPVNDNDVPIVPEPRPEQPLDFSRPVRRRRR
jgi:hypothetical protein